MAEKVMVRDPVPQCDYVFDKDYKLMTISEVDSFIAFNKHLPGVKSAKEFKKGYSLNEMDAVLLEKIEQLYLYIIKLNREIERLQRDNTNKR